MNTSSFTKPGNNTNDDVIVIGAGWSGLACAITLVQHGYRVSLFESARHAGGRAKSIHVKGPFSGYALDNGQHIMLGAYHYTQNIFTAIGLVNNEVLKRQPLELMMFSPEHPDICLKAPRLPAPLHLLYALLTLSGLTIKQRFSAIRFAVSLAISTYQLPGDISVKQLLQQYQQDDILITALWEPLCLATMNTPIDTASARIFLRVLKDSFSHRRQDSDLLFFKSDLTHLFCQPALNYLSSKGCSVYCANKVTEVTIIPGTDKSPGHFSIQSKQGIFNTKAVVLATPAHISDKLLHSSANIEAMNQASLLLPETASLSFTYEPICTVYLQYEQHIRLPSTMIGLFNTTGQWAIDRSVIKQPGVIAIVISGPGPHLKLTSDQLAQTVHNELSNSISHLPQPVHHKVITEKKATFSCHVNIHKQRPLNSTKIPGLYLAGDYTQTDYPSTLEGAIKSGVLAARSLIAQQ